MKSFVNYRSTRFEFVVNLRQIALFYGLLLGLSWILNNEMKAYISSIGLVIIPLEVGFSLYMIVNKLRSPQPTYLIDVRSALDWWMVGIISLTVFCSVSSVIFPTFTMVAGTVLSLFAAFFCLVLGQKTTSSKLVLSKKCLFSIFVLTAGILTPYLYLRRLSTFPLMLGGDMTGHLADIAAVSNGVRGINLYDDAFILLIGIVSSLAGSKALWLFWSGPLIQYALFAVGIYLLSRKILSNYYAPILAALVPLWFMGDGIMNDLIFLLRRNVLMALVPFFILCLMLDDERPTSKPSTSFLLAGLVPVFYYFTISNAFYISTVSRLPYILQALFQPGFLFTSPALTFDMPAANLQGLYVTVISLVVTYFLVKASRPGEKRLISSWAIVSLVAILINYRMGLMFSVIFFIFLILRSYSSFRAFFMLSITSLGLISLMFAGLDLTSMYWFTNNYTIFQISSSVWSLQQKSDFLSQNYGQVFVYLAFFSILYLSFAASKKPRIVSIITALTGLSLATYFLPFPSSERFLVLFTPFLVLLILISVETLVETYLKPRVVAEPYLNTLRATGPRPAKLHAQKTRISFTISFEKFVEVFALIILVVVSGFSITGQYDSNIRIYTSMYGATGSISSFNKYDLQVADWLKEHMPSETLIISDPATIQILSGLAEIPYTLRGRYFVNGLNTLSMVSGRTNLFRSILYSLSVDSLTELVSLFDMSDGITGISSADRRIIVVINNRTTAWLMGLAGYEYASSFYSFPGLAYLQTSSFSTSLYNASSSYIVYELTVPALVTTNGLDVSVQYGNSSVRNVTTIMTYYDLKNANYTLTLKGSDQYLIEGIPVTWLLDSVNAPEVLTLKITQLKDGSLLKIEKAIPSHTIVIHWMSNAILGDVVWKFVQWQDGWQNGPYSSSKAGRLQFASIEGMLGLNLSAGVKGGYSSVFRTGLSLPLNDVTHLFFGVIGTKNTQLAVAVDLTDGRRVFLFNSTGPTFFSIQPNFQIFEHKLKLENNVSISGIQIFILSDDGSSCESYIKYFLATQQ